MNTWKKLLVPLAVAAAWRSRPRDRELEPPADAVTHCRYGTEALAWATHDPMKGHDYFFTTGGATLELGWGYDGTAACVIGKNRGRYLVSWGWADPYGGNPELRVAVIERGKVINTRKAALGGWEIHPIGIASLHDGGWLIRYQDRDEDPVHTVRVNRNGD
jgi:hypothetical protein